MSNHSSNPAKGSHAGHQPIGLDYAHHDAHSPEEIKKHVQTYIVVFIALALLTAITVFVSTLDLRPTQAIVVAVFVASIKASLVALYFMHLISEKKVIFVMLFIAAVFFVVLMGLPVITETQVHSWLKTHLP